MSEKKSMRLVLLDIEHFKGLKNTLISLGGDSATVYGDNGTGKTTVADAISWLLWDKDSQGAKEFALKPLTVEGKNKEGVTSCQVAATFELADRNLSLEKIYKEKWTRRRGSAAPEFTGHETEYRVNGVPCPKKDYDATVAHIADPAVFRLLTDPFYFSSAMPWRDRRNLVLEVCGGVPDADVIASRDILADLPALLQGRKLDEQQRVVKARRAEINKELQTLPARIDEAGRGLVEVSADEARAAQQALAGLTAEIKDMELRREDLRQGENGAAIAAKSREMADLEIERAEIVKLAAGIKAEKAAELDRCREAERLSHDAITAAIREAERLAKERGEKGKTLEAMRDEVIALKKAQEAPECPTCGAERTAWKKSAKAAAVAGLVARGKALAEEVFGIDAALGEANARVIEAQVRHESVVGARVQAAVDLQAVTAENHPDWEGIVTGIQQLAGEIHALKTSGANDAAVQAMSDAITAKEAEAEACRKVIQSAKDATAIKSRVEELKARQKALAAEFEQMEKTVFLMEEFTKAKVGLLADRINGKFSMARFRMFNEQVNGGIEECCEVLRGGVPFTGGLNHGAQIQVGMDIIKTLSAHYGITMPVFVDNAEAVTSLPDMGDMQVVRLVVSEQDKLLRVVRHADGKDLECQIYREAA